MRRMGYCRQEEVIDENGMANVDDHYLDIIGFNDCPYEDYIDEHGNELEEDPNRKEEHGWDDYDF